MGDVPVGKHILLSSKTLYFEYTQIIIHKERVGYTVISQIYLHVRSIFKTISAPYIICR